jgi:hypothetical protein
MAQDKSGGTVCHNKPRPMTVRKELNQPLKRFVLNHPMIPTVCRGAGREGNGLKTIKLEPDHEGGEFIP